MSKFSNNLKEYLKFIKKRLILLTYFLLFFDMLIMSEVVLCFNFAEASEIGGSMEKIKSKGYAMFSKDGPFKPYEFERHAVGDNDILIKIRKNFRKGDNLFVAYHIG